MFALHPEYTKEIMTDTDGAYLASKMESNVIGFAWDYPSRVVPLQSADLVAHEISEYWRSVEYEVPKLANFPPRTCCSTPQNSMECTLADALMLSPLESDS